MISGLCPLASTSPDDHAKDRSPARLPLDSCRRVWVRTDNRSIPLRRPSLALDWSSSVWVHLRAGGVAGDPTTYYAGMPAGGAWKTTNGATTWKPIFDDVHVQSVGAVAVAPSQPNIVYVGTGNASG